uniref:Wsv321-like protein n=1 Tax=Hemigrapsus takanoi nimavirus TaxID=2133792 RepID=A0A401IP26_9VIRU|nr:wsv321-like protein [Hemigrapsus takanoi nimavirus]
MQTRRISYMYLTKDKDKNRMGIFTLLILVTVAAVVFASLFVTNSNYLDTNINKDLDVLNYLGLRMEMTPSMRKRVNNLLIPNLCIQTRLSIINAETARLNDRSFTTDASSTVSNPAPSSTATTNPTASGSSDSTSSSREELMLPTLREI